MSEKVSNNPNGGLNANNADWRKDAGPLRIYLNDKTVTEIMVNRYDRVFVERNGVIEECEARFDSTESLMRLAQAIAVNQGKELNRRTPFVDARLPDGSRVNVVIPPISLEGPVITIRKFSNSVITYNHLIQTGSVDDKIVYFLKQAVTAKQNIIVSGGTGSGKTTFLNILSSFIPQKERVVTMEDTAELQLSVKNLVRMETKPEMGSEPPTTMQELLVNALRMRPDRIVVGECRGPEAWDMLIAMNTGHEGSMTTLHANSASDALRRLENMVLRTGQEIPLSLIRNDIGNTVHFVLQTERSADGKRRLVEIIEIRGMHRDQYVIQKIFEFHPQLGFLSTGIVPQFVEDPMNQKRIRFPPDFFNPEYRPKLTA